MSSATEHHQVKGNFNVKDSIEPENIWHDEKSRNLESSKLQDQTAKGGERMK
jgi:hypothetical protein